MRWSKRGVTEKWGTELSTWGIMFNFCYYHFCGDHDVLIMCIVSCTVFCLCDLGSGPRELCVIRSSSAGSRVCIFTCFKTNSSIVSRVKFQYSWCSYCCPLPLSTFQYHIFGVQNHNCDCNLTIKRNAFSTIYFIILFIAMMLFDFVILGLVFKILILEFINNRIDGLWSRPINQ